MFRVKICGITNPRDAQQACEAGADAIGLNFYSGSPRYVTQSQATEIAKSIPPRVLKVGVFVNASAAEILATAKVTPLDVVQLHGDEPASFLAELASLRILKVFRAGSAGHSPIIDFLADCKKLGQLPEALLIDAAAPGQYGGSGQTVDWSAVPKIRSHLAGLPVVLAGGLKPENVGDAILAAQPDGVDVASGVEASPGVKDPEKVRRFVAAALAR